MNNVCEMFAEANLYKWLQEGFFRVKSLNAHVNAHSWTFDLVGMMVSFMHHLGWATVPSYSIHC